MIQNRTKRMRKKQETGNNVSSDFCNKNFVNPLNNATSSFRQLNAVKVILYAVDFNSGSRNTPGGMNDGCRAVHLASVRRNTAYSIRNLFRSHEETPPICHYALYGIVSDGFHCICQINARKLWRFAAQ